MSKGDTFENDLLKLIFNGTAIALLADNANATPLTNLYVALHVSDPGEAGNQLNNEAAYTNYARVAVSRNAAGWTVTANAAVNNAAVTFPQCGATGNTVTHFSVGQNGTLVAGKIYYSGALTSNLAVSNGITPQFAAGQLNCTED